MLGIICAMDLELQGLLDNITLSETFQKSGITFYKGRLANTEVVLAQCGIGKVNSAICTQLMIDSFPVEGIINSGVGGALSGDVTVGAVVVATSAVQHDYDTTALGDRRGELICGEKAVVNFMADEKLSERIVKAAENLDDIKVVRGVVATGDKFVADTDERLALGKEFSAVACEMEGGAMAQVCFRAQMPFAIIRSISDDITHNTSVSFDEFKFMAAKKTVDILLGALA